MNFFDRINRLDRIISLIRRRATGTPKAFACRLGCSERTLYNELEILRQYGAEIEYCTERKSFQFAEEISLCFYPVRQNGDKVSGGKAHFFWPVQDFCRIRSHL